MSEQGLLAVDRSGTLCRLEALTQHPVNVSGAGDTVFATVSAALAVGASLEEAAVLANVAASLAVAQEITHAVSAEELHGCGEQVLNACGTSPTCSEVLG